MGNFLVPFCVGCCKTIVRGHKYLIVLIKRTAEKFIFFFNLTQLPGTDDGNINNNTTTNNNIDAICDILFIHIVSFAQWCKETKATEYSS